MCQIWFELRLSIKRYLHIKFDDDQLTIELDQQATKKKRKIKNHKFKMRQEEKNSDFPSMLIIISSKMLNAKYRISVATA